MFQWLHQLGEEAQVASAIISIALMLAGGFLMTRVTKRLRLPNVTAYIVAGILMGPFCFHLVPEQIVQALPSCRILPWPLSPSARASFSASQP